MARLISKCCQPPLGGCVLKPYILSLNTIQGCQPPLGGCVLKQQGYPHCPFQPPQPPLGGCVLKLRSVPLSHPTAYPAAFRRLCVETLRKWGVEIRLFQPPLGGCVLKLNIVFQPVFCRCQPPLGGCVLKPTRNCIRVGLWSSRL